MSLFSIHALTHLITSYGAWLVGVAIALEAIGVPLPGESLLMAIAAYAGTTHKVGLVWIALPAIAGAIVGDNIGFLIGSSLGWRVLQRWGRHIGLNDDRLLLGAWLFRRHGAVVVFLGRFVAFLRTVVSLLAGANRMSWQSFLPSNAAGGIVWAGAYSCAAYFLGKEVTRIARPVAIGFGILAGAVIIAAFVLIRRREQALIEMARREMGDDAKRIAAGRAPRP